MTQTDKPQSEKFKQAARELECDDDEARFNERVRKLVKPRTGWAYYKLEPFRFVGPFASESEAQAHRDSKGMDWTIAFGEFATHPDGFRPTHWPNS